MHLPATHRLRWYRRAFRRYGASNKCCVGKTSHFLVLNVNISKTVGDTFKVTIND